MKSNFKNGNTPSNVMNYHLFTPLYKIFQSHWFPGLGISSKINYNEGLRVSMEERGKRMVRKGSSAQSRQSSEGRDWEKPGGNKKHPGPWVRLEGDGNVPVASFAILHLQRRQLDGS